jgi:hypothetical protein
MLPASNLGRSRTGSRASVVEGDDRRHPRGDCHAQDHRRTAGLTRWLHLGPERGARFGGFLGGPLRRVGNVDAFILSARYPGYEQYWQAVLDNPRGILPFTGRPATEGEIEYAGFAGRTPHFVVSSKLQTSSWKNTRIVRDLAEVRRLKEAPGRDMHAVGGATLVSSLINAGLVDEIRLVVQPIVLGGGKPLFKDVKERQVLSLRNAKPLQAGAVLLSYAVPCGQSSPTV